MKLFTITLISVGLLFTLSCNRKSKTETTDNPLHENCYLKHDPGSCLMNIKRYYYDVREKKCKEFIYGGCEGVVPFETLKECQKKCGCED